MTLSETLTYQEQEVPQALIRALFRHPWALQTALDDAGLAPRDLALWARRAGAAGDIEKLAGWLAVSQHPGAYKPLAEVAASSLRAGDWLEALPVFRWAYRVWGTTAAHDDTHRENGVKLLARWGQCLYALGRVEAAEEKWRWALGLIHEERDLRRLVRVMEESGADEASTGIVEEAVRRGLPGAATLRQRRQARPEAVPAQEPLRLRQPAARREAATGVAIVADVANLDMVCGEQHGFGRRLDYGRLAQRAEAWGRVHVQAAFVPDIPETLAVRGHLADVGFAIELQRPKRTHGRVSADADAGIAATAVRWASAPDIGRVELWTGDGDFLKVRDIIGAAWPSVTVAFRSFEAGTAAGIRLLEAAWEPIGADYLLA